VVSPPDAAHREPAAVLVIDDEDYVADMIATALELDGYVVHVAYNGRDGMEQARSAPVDLVVVDIMMPYIGGLGLIAQLRSLDHGREVPIILISAGARPSHPTEVELAVTDAGIGVPPEEREHIFERFYRARQTIRDGFKGSGIGLYICRSVVELHGGRIWAENRPEGGALFRFTLPKARPPRAKRRQV